MSIEKPISRNAVFVDGAAARADLLLVLARERKLVELDAKHSRHIGFYQGEFTFTGDTDWNANAICIVGQEQKRLICVGEDGEVFTYSAGSVGSEDLGVEPRAIRNLGVIDGHAYACGMGREVFRRRGENDWQPMPAPREGDEVCGFEAIDGFDADELYAVGWNGEIWQWHEARWVQRSSPTNLILTGVCCAGDGAVYVCGQHGTLLIGRGESWESIDIDDAIMDFWDVHWFEGRVYVASLSNLYTVTRDGGLEAVAFGADAPATCYRLTSADGVLWSVGAGDIFSFDGTRWQRID